MLGFVPRAAKLPAVEAWQRCLFSAALHALGSADIPFPPDSSVADIRTALRARSVGPVEAVSEEAQDDELRTLGLLKLQIAQDLPVVRAALRLAAFSWIRRSAPVVLPSRIALPDVVQLLERVPAGLRRCSESPVLSARAGFPGPQGRIVLPIAWPEAATNRPLHSFHEAHHRSEVSAAGGQGYKDRRRGGFGRKPPPQKGDGLLRYHHVRLGRVSEDGRARAPSSRTAPDFWSLGSSRRFLPRHDVLSHILQGAIRGLAPMRVATGYGATARSSGRFSSVPQSSHLGVR